MSLRSQVLSGLRWTAGARFASQIISWAITIFVIRLLSPGDYGLLAMATLFITFCSTFSEFGLGAAIVQAPELDEHKLRQMYGFILAVHLALFAILVAAAPFIAAFFDEPRLREIIWVLSLQFVLAAFTVVPESLLERRMEFKRRSFVYLLVTFINSVTTLILAFHGYGVWALVAGTLGGAVFKLIGINIISPNLRLPVFSVKGGRGFLLFGGQITASRFLWFFYGQADVFIAGKLLGKELLGFYSVAMHLASLPNQRISGILNQVAFPAFSRIQDDVARIGANLIMAMRVLSLFAFPVLWGISSVAPEIVAVLLGPKWLPAMLPLQILSLVMPLRMIGNLLSPARQAVGRADLEVRVLIVHCIVMPGAFLVGSHWGIEGLSIAWLVGTPFTFLWNLSQSLPVLGTSIPDVLRAMARPALAGAGMYGAVLGARALFALPPVLELIVLILVGAATYLALTALFNRQGIREVLGLLRG